MAGALVSMFLVPVSRIYIRGLQQHLESCSVFGQLMVTTDVVMMSPKHIAGWRPERGQLNFIEQQIAGGMTSQNLCPVNK